MGQEPPLSRRRKRSKEFRPEPRCDPFSGAPGRGRLLPYSGLMRRREFIAGLWGAAASPLTRALRADRLRISVLMTYDESDPYANAKLMNCGVCAMVPHFRTCLRG
jgi:hypothetical protein